MKYLNLFDNHNDYEDYVDGGLMSYPNVSYCIEEDELHYMKESPIHDYSKDYLTFEVVESGTITIKKSSSSAPTVTIQYSSNKGSTWTSLTTSTTEQSLGTYNIGDKVLVKGSNSAYAIDYSYYTYFSGTAKVNVYGNIMSLLYGDDFVGQTTLLNQYIFHGLFKNYTNLLSSENLILLATNLTENCYHSMFYGCTSLATAPELPATTLANGCYQYMFYGCTSLATAPELPATTLNTWCYAYMFNGCTSLNYIKCLATNRSATNCIYNWVTNVAAIGIFIKDANTTWSNGIPSGWTVQDA